jgi:hypothetical protein
MRSTSRPMRRLLLRRNPLGLLMHIHHTLGRRGVELQDLLSSVAVEGFRVDVHDTGGDASLFVEFLGLVDGLAEVAGEDGGGLLVGVADDCKEGRQYLRRSEGMRRTYRSRRPCCRAG